MKTKKTKTAAIKFARKMVGELWKFGDGYKFLVWDGGVKSWREHGGGDYWWERAHRARCLVMAGCTYMGMDEWQALYAADACTKNGGRWTDYVPAREVTART